MRATLALAPLAPSRSWSLPTATCWSAADHFKAINDQHGHLVGDRMITQIAAVLGRELDPATPLFRYGGEEFAVLLRDADRAAGMLLAERLRSAVEHGDFQEVRISASIGVAEWRATHGSIAAALDRADRALYAAKNAGRNRVRSELDLPGAAWHGVSQ
jgi:diguanylate cyclase (GGDEF)-like protein